MQASGSGARRVYLHVGAPKTGTTYLQARLSANVRELGEHGVLVPRTPWWSGRGELHFRAALDLLGEDWGGPPGHARGAWAQLLRRTRGHDGTVVISNELLATASPQIVAQVLADLAGEVHVVYTIRDLARLLPSAWQEAVKQGRTMRFRRFLDKAHEGDLWFARAFDLPQVLQTWGGSIPPERVHLVTVPRSGADPELLWGRFCGVVGIDPAWAPNTPGRRNESLGVAEIQVLRWLNKQLERRTNYRNDHLVKDMIAQRVLAGSPSVPVRLPPDDYPWVAELADAWITWVTRSGIDVVGDLEELRPQPPASGERWVDPDRFRPRQFRKAAIQALAAAVTVAAERDDSDRLTGKARRGATRIRTLVVPRHS
ncbi:MAG TPA: hypothetical protein VFL69_11755 [Marmoricola sp.]|nr:hypothetical protein [Marmoricola sp.]